WGTTCSAIETPRVSRLVEQRNFGRHHSETGRRCLAHSQISAIGAVETPWFAGTDATIGLCGDGPLEQPAKIRAPRIGPALAAVLLLALAAVYAVPRAIDAFYGLDDPSRVASRALDDTFDGAVAGREIEAALAANDADLAQSFVDLAAARNVVID